jgi:hypothetical protein
MHNPLDNLLVSVVLFEQVYKVLNVMDHDLRVLLTSFAESPLSLLLDFYVIQVLGDQRKQMLYKLTLYRRVWLLY